MKVAFLDLKAQYDAIREEIQPAIQAVIDQSAFAGGPFVEKFEAEFAEFCQSPFAVGVNSGTTALWIAMAGLGIGPGDEVITVPNTFIATVEAIVFAGATPVFVDVDEQTYTMDPRLLEEAITPATRAIIPVHLYGQMADMDPIMEIARRHKLFVIEDAAQAHGATYKGRRAGSIGHAGCFSFYPGKNLGAYGEGGAVLTHDEQLAAQMKMIRDHGQSKKYHHDILGWNARMDGIQGAILSVKLRHLEQWNAARADHARRYDEWLGDLDDIVTPARAEYAGHVYHIYPIRVQDRDELLHDLQEQGIGCAIHYPIPVHLQQAFFGMNYERGQFPVSEQCADELLSLPMFAELRDEEIEAVCQAVHQLWRSTLKREL